MRRGPTVPRGAKRATLRARPEHSITDLRTGRRSRKLATTDRHAARRIGFLFGIAAVVGLAALLMQASGRVASREAAAAGITVDGSSVTHQSAAATTVLSAPLTTSGANDLLVAFLASDGPNASGAQSFSSVTGGGLTWTLRQRTNAQAGTAEIWQAVAPGPLSGATFTATRSNGSYVGSMVVVAFGGASTTLNGAVAGASAASGAPTVTLTTTQAGSWVWGIGNDWDSATGRAAGANQVLVDQYLAAVGDTYWVQRQASAGNAANSPTTINDTAPTGDRWDLAAIEVVPAAAPTTPTVTATGTTTPPSPPQIGNIQASSITATSAVISWTTDIPGDSQVEYGTSTPYSSITTPDPTLVTAHSQTLAGLTPGVTYHYAVVSTSGANATTVSADQIFVTLSENITLPDMRIQVPTNLISIGTVQGKRQLQFTHITWDAGAGPFEIDPSYDANTGISTMTQAIYSSPSPGVWTFSHSVPVSANGVFVSPADYNFPLTRFTLNTVNGDGTPGAIVATSPKVDYCITGDAYVGSVPNTPNSTFIPQSNCTNPALPLGWSVGWGDQYDQTDSGQPIGLTGIADGTYILRAIADPQHVLTESDNTNNVTDTLLQISGGSVTVLSQSNPIVVPPAVAVTSPASGSTVSGSVLLQATASVAAPASIASVQFLLDGQPLGSPVTVAPYTFSWTIGTTPVGSHNLSARATDSTGNVGTAVAVGVTVGGTGTPTSTPTATSTAISTDTPTPTTTSTLSPTSTSTSSATATNTPVATNTAAATATSTAPSTATNTPAATNTAAATATSTPSATATNTPVATATDSSTPTATNTAAVTATSTAAATTTPTPTATITPTATNTPTPTATATNTPPNVSITNPTNNEVVSGTVPVAANASDDTAVASVQFFLNGQPLGSAVTVAPYAISWDTTTVPDGTYTLTAEATDNANLTTLSSPISVSVQNPGPPMTCFVLQAQATAHASGTATTPAFHTAMAGEVLVAFVSADGPKSKAQTATVSGAGLTWKLVNRANQQPGDAEVWVATAPAILTNGTVTARLASRGFKLDLTVIAMEGVSGIGASVAGSASTGAPSVNLTTTGPTSLVFAIGHDWYGATPRTLPANWVMLEQWVDATTGDTYWSQYTNNPTGPAGSVVNVSDVAPTTDGWDLVAVELLNDGA